MNRSLSSTTVVLNHWSSGLATFSLAILVVVVAATPSFGQAPDPDPQRFAKAVETFTRWDEKNAAPENAVLFVGSSSIRFWKTADRFPGLPVINRGFGGSHISDVVHYLEQTVLRHRPRAVVFYAGDNDIAAGKSAEQVLEDYREFVDLLHTAQPETPVIFLGIKPSIARWTLWTEMERANGMIAEFSAGHPALHILDLGDDLRGPDGKPRKELLIADGLHFSEAGYDLFTQRTRVRLEELRLIP